MRKSLMSQLNTPQIGEINATSPLSTDATRTSDASATYEAPAIESVVTFDNLQREVLYAGNTAPITVTNTIPIPTR